MKNSVTYVSMQIYGADFKNDFKNSIGEMVYYLLVVKLIYKWIIHEK